MSPNQPLQQMRGKRHAAQHVVESVKPCAGTELAAIDVGITQRREIARLCRESVVFTALSADTTPHFTTIADVISTMQAEIVGRQF